MKTVFVGLSGGVDSAVSAYLLKQAGLKVVGVYMKNWTQDIASFSCPWREDYLSAKEVASFLEIDFLSFDFQTEYKQLVVDYMIEEYKFGRTPNPDIVCNSEIKFNLFLKACQRAGADLIATGHYAKIKNQNLYISKDEVKDQTYFLYKIPVSAIGQTLFPLADYLKSEVRSMAKKIKLPNANRAESMGICFVGEVGLEDFIKQYISLETGDIVDDTGQIVGKHQGSILYTIGQRHGLGIGGGLPYYVTSKDVLKNIVYVSRNLNHRDLWSKKIQITNINKLKDFKLNYRYLIRYRHGGKLNPAKIIEEKEDSLVLEFVEELKALAKGQSVVIYDRNLMVGGGVIN